MMTCRELVASLGDLIAEELDEVTREMARDHLAACRPCVLIFESYRVTVHLAHRLPPRPLSAEQQARIRAALAAGPGGGWAPAPETG